MPSIDLNTVSIDAAIDPVADYLHYIDQSTTPKSLKRLLPIDFLRGAGIKRRNMVEFASLGAAVTAIGATPCELVIGSAYTASGSTNLTFPATCCLVWENDGKITVPAGRTLTINKMRDPGDKHVVALASNTAHVRYGPGAVHHFNVKWQVADGAVDLTAAYNDCLASCTANGNGVVYTPDGEWTTAGGHIVPGKTRLYAPGHRSMTLTHTVNNTFMFKIGESTYFTAFDHMFLIGINGATSTSIGILCAGAAPNTSGWLGLKDTHIGGFGVGLEIRSTSGGWQMANVYGDHECTIAGNDVGLVNNSDNTNFTFNGLMQSNWVPAAGADAAYPQYLGKFSKSGPMTFTGEFAGAGPTVYGRHQTETVIVPSGDLVTAVGGAYTAGYVKLSVHAATLRERAYGGLNSTVDIIVPVNSTDHNTAAKLATAYREALGSDASVTQIANVASVAFSTDRDVSMIFLDPASAPDTSAFVHVDNLGTAGVTSIAASTRTDPTAGSLPMGFQFTGSHAPVRFTGCVDEAIYSFIIADADEVESVFTFDACQIQGAVRLNKKCTAVFNGGQIASRQIRDGGHFDNTAYGGSRIEFHNVAVPLYTNIWIASGAVIYKMAGRKAHNFAMIAGDDKNNSVVSFETNPHDYTLRSQYRGIFWGNDDPDMPIATKAWANLIAATPYGADPTQKPFFVGNCDQMGNPTYGYPFRRNSLGYLEVDSNQDVAFSAVTTNGLMFAGAFIPGVLSASQTVGVSVVNNYNPGLYWMKGMLRTSSDQACTFTGLAAPVVGGTPLVDGGVIVNSGPQMISGYAGYWVNTGAFVQTFAHDDGTRSASVNRFYTPGSVNFVLAAGAMMYIWYDITSNRWRLR